MLFDLYTTIDDDDDKCYASSVSGLFLLRFLDFGIPQSPSVMSDTPLFRSSEV